MGPLTSFVTTTSTALLPLVVPLGIVGIVIGLVLTMVGYNHGANFLRTAIIATIVAIAASVIGPNLTTLIK